MTNVNVEISGDHKMTINKGYWLKLAIGRKSATIICIWQRLEDRASNGKLSLEKVNLGLLLDSNGT